MGALLSELRVSLGEIAEVQRVAIGVLRDLLAKHSFDDRYLQSVSNFMEHCWREGLKLLNTTENLYILIMQCLIKITLSNLVKNLYNYAVPDKNNIK